MAGKSHMTNIHNTLAVTGNVREKPQIRFSFPFLILPGRAPGSTCAGRRDVSQAVSGHGGR